MNCGTVGWFLKHRCSQRGYLFVCLFVCCCCCFWGDCFAKVLDVKAYVDCCSLCSCQLSCLCCMKSEGFLHVLSDLIPEELGTGLLASPAPAPPQPPWEGRTGWQEESQTQKWKLQLPEVGIPLANDFASWGVFGSMYEWIFLWTLAKWTMDAETYRRRSQKWMNTFSCYRRNRLFHNICRTDPFSISILNVTLEKPDDTQYMAGIEGTIFHVTRLIQLVHLGFLF